MAHSTQHQGWFWSRYPWKSTTSGQPGHSVAKSPRTRHQCKEDGKCVLFSTHIMREAERIADRIVMIHQGKLLAEGSWDEMKTETQKNDLDDIFVHYVNSTKTDEGVNQNEY